MAQLFNQRRMSALMQLHGWQRTRGGKHAVKMEKAGHRPVTLPHHHGQDYGKQLSQAILKQAGLRKEDQAWSSRSSYARKGRGTGQRSTSSRDASQQVER